MKDKKTGLRKEIILITSIVLLIISITSSGTKLYFSIPSALVCFLCETYGLANRTQNKKYKFIFSVFSPFCFLFLHFWLLYLCKDPSTMMKRAHSSYIIAIVIIALLDIWYSSLISEKVQPPIVQQIDFSEIPAPVENITSEEEYQDKKMELVPVMCILKKRVNLLSKKKMRMLVYFKEHLKLVSTERQELWISFVM